MLLAVAMLLVPIAMNPPMYFLWLPIGLTVVFSTALVVAGRRGAKRAVLATAMALIVLFLAVAVLCLVAWFAYIVYAVAVIVMQ